MKMKILIIIFCFAACFQILLTQGSSATEANKPKDTIGAQVKCIKDQGCISRNKFFTSVYGEEEDGKFDKTKPEVNFKILYLFTDRIVLYQSANPDNPDKDPEQPDLTQSEISERTVKVIPFGQIPLDCGMYTNKLCFAGDYNKILATSAYAELEGNTKVKNALVSCLAIPYFNGQFKEKGKKIAYICEGNSKNLQHLIEFKNEASRAIEEYQFHVSDDRYSPFNALLYYKGKFVTFLKKKGIPVKTRFYGKKILMESLDKNQKFFKEFALLELRKSGIYIAKQGMEKKKVPKNWKQSLNPPPNDDCCLYLPGEQNVLILCLANSDGKTIRTDSSTCSLELGKVKKQVKNMIKGIKTVDAVKELVNYPKKRKECNSKEYNIFKCRIDFQMMYTIDKDCRVLLEYSDMSYEELKTYCYNLFSDQVKEEIILLSLGNEAVYNKANDCIYKEEEYVHKLSNTYFNALLKKFKLNDKSHPANMSFLQVKAEEQNGFDEDDVEEVKPSTHSNLRRDSSDINFTETKSKNKGTRGSNTGSGGNLYADDSNDFERGKEANNINNLSYSGNEGGGSSSLKKNKLGIFKKDQMNYLQKTKQYRAAKQQTIMFTGKEFVQESNLSVSIDPFIDYLKKLSMRTMNANKKVLNGIMTELSKWPQLDGSNKRSD